jgi:hypothetical protein
VWSPLYATTACGLFTPIHQAGLSNPPPARLDLGQQKVCRIVLVVASGTVCELVLFRRRTLVGERFAAKLPRGSLRALSSESLGSERASGEIASHKLGVRSRCCEGTTDFGQNLKICSTAYLKRGVFNLTGCRTFLGSLAKFFAVDPVRLSGT